MSTYKELHGRSIVPASSNPAVSGDAGKIFYNSTDNVFRSIVSIEAWSAGANTGIAKQRPGACGTQTAGLSCGGFTAPPTSALGSTEEYNGTGWSAGGTLNTARGNTQLIGTQTAAAFIGKGSPSTPYAGTTELYNGTAWTTNPNAANDTYNYRSGCGTQTAGLITGGNYPPTNRAAGNEEFDGTSFSEGGDLPQKQSSNGQAGTQTAAINSFGATNNPVPGNSGDGNNAISLEYDGTSWTAGPNGYGVVALAGYSMGAGTQTDSLFAGAPSTNSCKYDGTTFTVGPALAVAQDSSGQSQGPAAAGWICQGSPVPSVGSRTQEFNRSTDVLTPGAWASGGNMNTGRYATGGAGTRPAAIAFGGYDSSTSGKTEEYDGTSWTENNDMGTGRFYVSGSGTQTAALAVAGRTGPGPSGNFAKTVVEEYDGTSWSEQNDIPSSLNGMMGAGTQTAAVHFGGIATPGGSSSTGTLEYDGTNWTSGGALPTAAKYGIGVGTQTAALHAGGGALGSYYYNGTSWSDQSSNLLTQNNPLGIFFAGSSGTQTSALIAGGGNPSTGVTATDTQEWNGTSWFTQPSLGTARNAGAQGGVGTATTGIAFGGQGSAPPYAVQNGTEEFTPESTSVNVKTITTS